MPVRSWLVAAAFGAATALVTLDGAAQSTTVPTAYARRELTLPNITLRFDDGPNWPIPTGVVETTVVDTGDGHDTFTALNLGFGIGIIKSLELGMRLVRYEFDPGEMRDPSVYGLWRFLQNETLELGLYAEVKLPFKTDVVLTVGMPVAVHLGEIARIDTGPFIVLPQRSGDDPDFVSPFELPINVAEQVYLGPEFGVYAPDFDDAFFFTGFFAGYTIQAGGGMLGDVGGRFRIPDIEQGLDIFQVMLELQFYFDL